jgi:Nif11 domain
MSREGVVDFLNQVAKDPSLRSNAQSTYQSEGVDGLVQLGSQQGKNFTGEELQSIISPSELQVGAQGVSIGWG